MTLDDILRLLRHRIRIEIVLSLDEQTTGDNRHTVKCDICGKVIGTYTTKDSADRAKRSHAQNCKGDNEHSDLFKWAQGEE